MEIGFDGCWVFLDELGFKIDGIVWKYDGAVLVILSIALK